MNIKFLSFDNLNLSRNLNDIITQKRIEILMTSLTFICCLIKTLRLITFNLIMKS